MRGKNDYRGDLKSGILLGQSTSLDIVSSNLTSNLLNNYQEVLEAMNLILLLNYQLNLSTTNIRETRQVLMHAKDEICQHPLSFFRQISKPKNLAVVMELVWKMGTISKSSDDLQSALNSREFQTGLTL
jgi:hypothetical protein